ncbi:MAG: hypothetical protein HWD61_13395 [Parachlamydiaceae bacterium]|nr:MAG: hypothetical protein HWD61_13395 [Parachlamydiaceae bacterium]
MKQKLAELDTKQATSKALPQVPVKNETLEAALERISQLEQSLEESEGNSKKFFVVLLKNLRIT